MAKKYDEKVLYEALDNPFVRDFNGDKLVYSQDFYVVLYKKLQSGMKPIEAYESLGLDTKKLGTDRAYAACRRANYLGDNNKFAVSPAMFDGTVPREKMGELTPEEELAYFKARSMYLEKMVELQKKIPLFVEETLISLKKEK